MDIIRTGYRFIILPVSILAIMASTACSRAETASAAPAPGGGRGGSGGSGGGAVPVTIAQAVQKPMPLQVAVIGSVEASSTVAVRSQITGQLTSVNFKEGDDVAQGQVLFTLDRRPLEGALAQAQANLARDEAQSANAKEQ